MSRKRSKPPDRPIPQEIGHDGWPTEVDQPTLESLFDPPVDPREERFRRDLRICEQAWLAGSFPALFDAVVLCGQQERPLPFWVSRAVLEMLQDQFSDRTSKSRGGRHSTPKKAFIDNYIHYIRWDAVRELRDRRHELRERERQLRDPQGQPVEPIETSWDHVYDTVSDYLERCKGDDHMAKGSPGAIKRSYQLVEAARKNGTDAKFYQPRYFRFRRR